MSNDLGLVCRPELPQLISNSLDVFPDQALELLTKCYHLLMADHIEQSLVERWLPELEAFSQKHDFATLYANTAYLCSRDNPLIWYTCKQQLANLASKENPFLTALKYPKDVETLIHDSENPITLPISVIELLCIEGDYAELGLMIIDLLRHLFTQKNTSLLPPSIAVTSIDLWIGWSGSLTIYLTETTLRLDKAYHVRNSETLLPLIFQWARRNNSLLYASQDQVIQESKDSDLWYNWQQRNLD